MSSLVTYSTPTLVSISKKIESSCFTFIGTYFFVFLDQYSTLPFFNLTSLYESERTSVKTPDSVSPYRLVNFTY